MDDITDIMIEEGWSHETLIIILGRILRDLGVNEEVIYELKKRGDIYENPTHPNDDFADDLEERGATAEELDELLYDIAHEEVSETNNAGLREQVGYLLDRVPKEFVENTLEERGVIE